MGSEFQVMPLTKRRPGVHTKRCASGAVPDLRWIGLLVLAPVLLSAGEPPKPATKTSTAEWVMIGCRALVAADSKDEFRQGVCVGEVAGIAAVGAIANQTCVPDTAPNQELVRVVVQFVDAHLQRLQEPFSVLALEALRTAWPCTKP